MIAEFLQEWCDRNNKLVLVSYDAEKEAEDVNYKLKLEIFGFKKEWETQAVKSHFPNSIMFT